MTKLLAFDYGASSGRAILGEFDGSKLQLNEMHRFPNEPVNAGGTLYWDILRLFHEMKQGLIKTVNLSGNDLDAIGIDTWGVDFGLLDRSGRLLGNPCHYRDSNTRGVMEEAFKIIPRHEIFYLTGIQFQEFNTLYQLFSMVIKQAPLLEKAADLLFIPDLFRYFLTGEKNTEYTIASTSQMLDSSDGRWARSLLDRLGIRSDILTGIIEPGTVTGTVAPGVSRELGIGSIPVVAVAEHDTASAVVSVPAVQGQCAYLSSGTWSLLGVESAKPVINKYTFDMNYTNEGGFNRKTRLLKNIMGLWIYQECKRTWDMQGEVLSFDELEMRAEESEPFMALIDPDDSMFYYPGDMPSKIQEYCVKTRQKIPETKGQIVRCVMESLALKYRQTFEGLEKIAGSKLPVLHIVGGGSRNEMLSRFTANSIKRSVVAGPVEATAIGNLIVQLIALGELSGLEEGRAVVRRSFPTGEYEPEDAERWDCAYEMFLGIIKSSEGETRNV